MAPAKKSKKKMTLDQARRLLKRNDWITPVYCRGYKWVEAKYKPAVELLSAERRRKSDHELAGQGWYVIGDVHDFNKAPKSAIRAYRKCLKLIPWQTGAHREIGGMLENMGEYDKARRIWKQGLRIDPEDYCKIQDDWDFMEECSTLPGDEYHIYQEGDVAWEARELLASGKPKAALRKVHEVDTPDAAHCRTQAYCVLGESQKVQKEWEQLSFRTEPIVVEISDYYYMGRTLFQTVACWESIERMARNDKFHMYWRVRGAEKAIPDPKKPRHGSKAHMKRFEQRLNLEIQYELILTRKDVEAAQKLADKYSAWSEAQSLLKYLKTGKW